LCAPVGGGTLEVRAVKEVLVMESMWLVLFWTGPIGVGFFLACLGAMILMLSKADEINKRTKAMTRQDHNV
jgi:hypothetical protein